MPTGKIWLRSKRYWTRIAGLHLEHAEAVFKGAARSVESGRLGQSLADAIQQVDDSTSGYPAYFMINCAHPSHFDHVVGGGKRGWTVSAVFARTPRV